MGVQVPPRTYYISVFPEQPSDLTKVTEAEGNRVRITAPVSLLASRFLLAFLGLNYTGLLRVFICMRERDLYLNLST